MSFTARKPPSWEDYLVERRKYWGEDRITGTRSSHFTWKGSESAWLEHTRAGYESYVIHCSKWLGKFARDELIPVFKTDRRSTVKLCVVKGNMTTWHDTVELWLFREVGLYPPRITLRCQVYTFSTTVKDNGDPT